MVTFLSLTATAGTVIFLGLPIAAAGDETHRVELHVGTDHESCYFDLHSELTEAEFHTFAAEGGQIIRFRQLSAADTLGRGIFDVSAGYALFFLDDTKGAWNNTMSHPDADHYLGQELGFPQLALRLGVTDDVDGEVFGSLNWLSNYGFVGGASKIRVLRQSETMPVSLAVRPSVSALLGPSELQVFNGAADVAVSRSFGGLSPFAGATLNTTLVRETSPDTDVASQVAYRPLGFAGVEYRWKHASAAAQAELSDLVAFGVRAGGTF